LRGNEDNVLETIIHKEWVGGHVGLRKLDPRLADFAANRIKVLRGADAADLKVQLWKSSVADDRPTGTGTNCDYTLKIKKPTVFYDRNFDAGGLCPGLDHPKVFGDFLRANPELKENIVICKNAGRGFQKARRDILIRLNGVSRSRLRFFIRATVTWAITSFGSSRRGIE
jgi:hypothetical protein